MLGVFFLGTLVSTTASVFYFFVKRNAGSVQNAEFMARYTHLIKLLIENRHAEIKKLKRDSITISIKLNRDTHLFNISEKNQAILIVWKLNSRSLGKKEIHWSFEQHLNQAKIYGEILTQIRNIQGELRKAKPFLDESSLSAA